MRATVPTPVATQPAAHDRRTCQVFVWPVGSWGLGGDHTLPHRLRIGIHVRYTIDDRAGRGKVYIIDIDIDILDAFSTR